MAPPQQNPQQQGTKVEEVKAAVPDKVEVPRDQPPLAKAAAPVATLSSHTDPYPHYTAALLSGAAATSFYRTKRIPEALAAGGFALSYFSAGRMVTGGMSRTGYDLGTGTSLGLLAWMGPAAGMNTISTMLATVGGLSAVANGIKSYESRTGVPHELVEK